MNMKTHITYLYAFLGKNSVRNPNSEHYAVKHIVQHQAEPVLQQTRPGPSTSLHPWKVEQERGKELALQRETIHICFSQRKELLRIQVFYLQTVRNHPWESPGICSSGHILQAPVALGADSDFSFNPEWFGKEERNHATDGMSICFAWNMTGILLWIP